MIIFSWEVAHWIDEPHNDEDERQCETDVSHGWHGHKGLYYELEGEENVLVWCLLDVVFNHIL